MNESPVSTTIKRVVARRVAVTRFADAAGLFEVVASTGFSVDSESDQRRLRAAALALRAQQALSLLGRPVTKPSPDASEILSTTTNLDPPIIGPSLHYLRSLKMRRHISHLSEQEEWHRLSLRSHKRAAQAGKLLHNFGPQIPVQARDKVSCAPPIALVGTTADYSQQISVTLSSAAGKLLALV